MRQNDSICSFHGLPITQIQFPLRRLLCENCLSQTSGQRLERLQFLRAQLSEKFVSELSELKKLKETYERITELFCGKNLFEVKKIINKSLPDIQKRFKQLLQQQVMKSNVLIRNKAAQLFAPYEGSESFLQSCMELEDAFPNIEKQMNAFKQLLHKEIANKIKMEVRFHFQKMFEFEE